MELAQGKEERGERVITIRGLLLGKIILYKSPASPVFHNVESVILPFV